MVPQIQVGQRTMNNRYPKPVSVQLPEKWPDLSGQNGST